MAWHLFGTKPLSMLLLDWWQWNLNQNVKVFIHENASENIVCEMAAILTRGTWVNEMTKVLQQITDAYMHQQILAKWLKLKIFDKCLTIGLNSTPVKNYYYHSKDWCFFSLWSLALDQTYRYCEEVKISTMEIRWSWDHLISEIEIPNHNTSLQWIKTDISKQRVSLHNRINDTTIIRWSYLHNGNPNTNKKDIFILRHLPLIQYDDTISLLV